MLEALKAKGKKKILSDMMDEQIEAAQELTYGADACC